MKGFTKIESPEDLKPGDVLLLPPRNRALHVTTSTLSKHGLSNGDTCRSLNDARLVARIFPATFETGAALMVSHADVRDAAPPARVARGTNTLSAYAPPRKRVNTVCAHLLDGDMLPTVGNKGTILGCVAPLTDAVYKRFSELAHPEAYSAIETRDWQLRGRPNLKMWKALRLVTEPPFAQGPDSIMPMVPAQPMGDNDADRTEAVTRRLFCSGNTYAFRSGNSKADTLTMGEKITLHLISNGMEIHRPDPDTWKLLAERVLARHARVALEQILGTKRTVLAFTEAMKSDLEEFDKMAHWWEDHATALAARRSWIRSPYRQGKA